jgi:hypothetical protein
MCALATLDGLVQMGHPARPVPRTPTRLLRAVLRPPAFVMQASVGTPAQEHAQRVLQASTNRQQAMVNARTVERASTGSLQDNPPKHPARPVPRTPTRLLRAVLRPPAFVMQATVATPAQEHAQRVLQASTNRQQAIVNARTVELASTGLLQDNPPKHPAWPAARASTGRKQEDQMKHRARLVPRAPTHLLRAVLRPPAFVMQATVASPAQEHAQRVLQASTNRQQAIVNARTVERASTGLLQDNPLKHPAWPAARASTGRKQEDQMKNRARLVPRAPTHLLRAVLRPPAFVMQASVASPAQEHAQRVLQASTNRQQAIVNARTVERASTGSLQDNPPKHPAWPAAQASTGRKQEDQMKHRARLVPPTPARLLRAVLRPPAFVIQATVATPAQEHAQRVLQASTNRQQANL